MTSTNLQQRAAEPARWDPAEELEQLQQHLAQVFSDWPFGGQSRGHLPSGPNGPNGEFAPLADVEETNDAFLIELDLPGVTSGDVNLEVSGRRLTVSGERKEKERKGIVRRRTRTVGRFRYEIVMPVDVDDAKVEAKMDKGVLTIKIPKHVGDQPKRIPIR